MKTRSKLLIVGLAVGMLAGAVYLRARKEHRETERSPKNDSEYVEFYFV